MSLLQKRFKISFKKILKKYCKFFYGIENVLKLLKHNQLAINSIQKKLIGKCSIWILEFFINILYIMNTESELISTIKADPILSNQFVLGNVIGQGRFSIVYEAYNIQKKKAVALKIQGNFEEKNFFLLHKEYRILCQLAQCSKIVKSYSFGKWRCGYYLELQKHQKTLSHWMKKNKRLSKDQIEQLAVQLLQIVKQIHNEGFIHRDIKPQNFVLNRNNQWVLIDFGIAAKITCNLQDKKVNNFVGNLQFASTRTHQYKNQSQKDDLQSIFYLLAFVYHRKLPWQTLEGQKKDRIQICLALKNKFSSKLFESMGQNFAKAFTYIKNLTHAQTPNYNFIIQLFQKKKKREPSIEYLKQSGLKKSIRQQQLKKRKSSKLQNQQLAKIIQVSTKIQSKRQSILQNNQRRRSSFFFQANKIFGEKSQSYQPTSNSSLLSISDTSNEQLEGRKKIPNYLLSLDDKNPFTKV